MADIQDISDIAGKFKNVAELRKYAEDLFKKVKLYTETIVKQKEEIDHLKQLLDGSTSSLTGQIADPNLPVGQLLCEMEIMRLEKTAATRALTIEEAKRFDIYNKNLLAIKKPKKDSEDDHVLEHLDDKALIEIAKK